MTAPVRNNATRFPSDVDCCAAGPPLCSATAPLEIPPIIRKQRTTGRRSRAAPRGVAHTAQPLLFPAPSKKPAARVAAPRRTDMLETIAIILIVLWLLGMVSGYTLGNFIYVLLVIAIVLFLVRLISGRTV
jgi:hypothetical protein